MAQSNKTQSKVQVREIKNGTMECFSFELPTGQLKQKHLDAFLKFLEENQVSEVMKALLHIYFTARSDQFFEMDEIQRISFEHTLTLLADLTCENVIGKRYAFE